MKFYTIFAVIAFCALNFSGALVTPHNNPVGIPTQAPRISLAQDINEILRIIPQKQIKQLAIRYLLNDQQFQTVVRLINSYDGYLTQMRFRTQPEVLNLISWLRGQILLSGDELQSDESNESLIIVNRTPFWSQNVYGWQGFVNELLYYYPEDQLRAHIQAKIASNAAFAELIQRIRALKPVYERVIALPEAQRLIAALEANGINTIDIDTFIRNQLGWQQISNAAGAPVKQQLQG